MKIKQQKDIKAFLDGRLDDDSARNLFDSQSRLLEDLISKTSGKSKNQKKTLQQTILPRIALYQALSGSSLPRNEALDLMRSYMIDVVAAQKHAQTAMMEAVPGFFAIYKRVFLRVMRTSDLWESTQWQGRGFF